MNSTAVKLTERQVVELELNKNGNWIAAREWVVDDDRSYEFYAGIVFDRVHGKFIVWKDIESSVTDAYQCDSLKQALETASKELGVDDEHWDYLNLSADLMVSSDWLEDGKWFSNLPKPAHFTSRNSVRKDGFVYRYRCNGVSYDWKNYVLDQMNVV